MASCFMKKRNCIWLIFFMSVPSDSKYVMSSSYIMSPTSDFELTLGEHENVRNVLVRLCDRTAVVTSNNPLSYLHGIKKKKKKIKLKRVDISYAGQYQIISYLNSSHNYLEDIFMLVYNSKGPSLSPVKLVTGKTYSVVVSLLYSHNSWGDLVPLVKYDWTLGGILVTSRNSDKTSGCPVRGESILRLDTQRYLGGQNLTCHITLEYGPNSRDWSLSRTIYAPVMISAIERTDIGESVQLSCLIDYHQFPRSVDYSWYEQNGGETTVLESRTSTVLIHSLKRPVVVFCNASNSISSDSKSMSLTVPSTNKSTSTSDYLRSSTSVENKFVWLIMGVGFGIFGLAVVQAMYCVSKHRLKTAVHSMTNREIEMNWGRCSAWRGQKEERLASTSVPMIADLVT